MSDDYQAQAAELLSKHFADEGLNTCEAPRCKFETWDLPFVERLAAFAAHQAEVLAAAGLIPTSTEWGSRMTWDGPKGPTSQLTFRGVTDWKDAT